MSVSTRSSRPPFNRFYDDSAISAQLSVDSFVDRDVHERKEAAANRRKTKGEKTFGPWEEIMETFRACCVPASRKLMRAQGAEGEGKKEEEDAKLLSFMNKMHPAGSTSSSDASSTDGSSETTTVPGEEEEEGSGTTVTWRIELQQPPTFDKPLSTEQLQWCIADWARRVETSEQMKGRMLIELLTAAQRQKKKVDIEMVFLNEKQFLPLEFVRCIEVRVLEDVLGDLMDMFDQMGSTGGVYAILSKERVLGMYARKQGDVMDVVVFDPRPSEEEEETGGGPAFIGFSTLDDMIEFVSDIFTAQQGNSKLTVWLIRSRTSYDRSPYTKSYSRQPTLARDDWRELEKARRKDSRYDVKLVYGAMYNVTAKPVIGENIFSWEPGQGMHVESPAMVAQQRHVHRVADLSGEADDVPIKQWK
eukprot:GHVS01009689.1.p2 GENE.GHVS01009689.1~~GHVS01009689.1.p2  ORF type:complete len:438 (-),score=96.65 GHVS01009689.1:1710-2963(-)